MSRHRTTSATLIAVIAIGCVRSETNRPATSGYVEDGVATPAPTSPYEPPPSVMAPPMAKGGGPASAADEPDSSDGVGMPLFLKRGDAPRAPTNLVPRAQRSHVSVGGTHPWLFPAAMLLTLTILPFQRERAPSTSSPSTQSPPPDAGIP